LKEAIGVSLSFVKDIVIVFSLKGSIKRVVEGIIKRYVISVDSEDLIHNIKANYSYFILVDIAVFVFRISKGFV